MMKTRISSNLHTHTPFNSPRHCSHTSIHRSSLRFDQPNPIPRRRIQITFCTSVPLNSLTNNDNRDTDLLSKTIIVPSGDLSVKTVTLISVATLTSKILGLIREVTMASVFGVGPVATAFKYAWVLPGFSSSLLGGVNGPIHIIMATILSKLPKHRREKLFQHTTTIMFLVGGVVGALVYIFSEFIIHIYAPGLWILAEGRIIREIAIEQLKIMTPCIVLAGPVGLGFGYMSAEGNNILPSISPALSSSLLIVSCLIYTFTRQSSASCSGGSLVSLGVSLGLFLQWIIQTMVLRGRWCNGIPDSLTTAFTSGDVHEFFSLLLPATISSGLAQIASFTDLCFASFIPGAAAGLSYAYLMVMAPVGALSSIVVLPLLPSISKLVKTASWESLVENLIRSVLLCMVVLLPILSIMWILAEPIIHMLFERYAFDSSARALVSSLFVAYSFSAPFFIIRDLLVAVFYALGDGKGPFLVSVGAVALNAILNWLSVSRYHLGARGLALSTSFTAAMSVVIMFYLLQKKRPGLSNYTALINPIMLLHFCCITSSFSTSISYKMTCNMLTSTIQTRFYVTKEFLAILLASVVGMIAFFLPVVLLHFSGFEFVKDLYRTLMNQKSLRN
ncbi:putative lipid II flippase MurJ [Forsythia ovata]|uniref:Lipid II flippase MurJ n=1 Tax=Forsythia ovata TaxID=205694 RepID=A0ABD1UE30_9LAMI